MTAGPSPPASLPCDKDLIASLPCAPLARGRETAGPAPHDPADPAMVGVAAVTQPSDSDCRDTAASQPSPAQLGTLYAGPAQRGTALFGFTFLHSPSPSPIPVPCSLPPAQALTARGTMPTAARRRGAGRGHRSGPGRAGEGGAAAADWPADDDSRVYVLLVCAARWTRSARWTARVRPVPLACPGSLATSDSDTSETMPRRHVRACVCARVCVRASGPTLGSESRLGPGQGPASLRPSPTRITRGGGRVAAAGGGRRRRMASGTPERRGATGRYVA